MSTRTFVQTLVTIVVVTILIFSLWLIKENITSKEIKLFAIGLGIVVIVALLVIMIISFGILNFCAVSKTIQEIGTTYFVNFSETVNRKSEIAHPIIIHNTGTNAQTLPDQKLAILKTHSQAEGSEPKKQEIEYKTYKELLQGSNFEQLDDRYFQDKNFNKLD